MQMYMEKYLKKYEGSKWGFDPIFVPKGQTLSVLTNKE
ncbi:hypothetical protein DYY67_2192 [Candidatus Nitrosotalea sp. TS]|nr:hypothetical protein [Candidatus Nitrosotalea sp. TS]